MDCPNCGIALRDGAVFCSNCGQRLSGGDPTTTAAAAARRAGPPPDTGGPWQGRADGAPGQGAPGATSAPPWQSAAGRPPGSGVGRGAYGLGGARTSSGGEVGTLLSRMGRLLTRGDAAVFRELRDDTTALVPSLAVAAAAIVLMALGAWLWELIELRSSPGFQPGQVFVRSVIVGSVFGFVLWAAWIWLATFLLAQGFRRRADFLGALRAAGVAAAPLALGVVMMVDLVRLPLGIGCIGAAAMLTQVALQEATEAGPGEVFLANLTGFGLWCLVLGLFGRGPLDLAPGIWVFG